MKKTVIKWICIALAAVLLLVLSYAAYVFLSYYRVEDNLQLDVSGSAEKAVPVNQSLKLVSYNIGFGAYSDDYSFFMDGGEYSRARSKQAVLDNTAGALNAIKSENPDFITLQEVDVKGTRSHNVNQVQLATNTFGGFDTVFAQNYDSPYFLYPFNEPIGANKSGILTASSFNIEGAKRRSLPIEESLYKLVDLDRAYSISRIPTENGKVLVLFNVHLSAYTSDGKISDEQLKMLSSDMNTEYSKGNYVIAAGDFNKDLLGDSSKYFKRTEGEFNWAKPFETTLLPKGFGVYTGANKPTCRNADSAFRNDGTDFILSVDGALVSDNIKVILCETIDTGFKFSDHNPVKLEFQLLGQ